MDPLAAAGLAGSIIQFVDFSTKVLASARRLYESASGATEENDELESLTRNLRDLANRTRYQPSLVPRKSYSSLSATSEKVLDSLSRQCIQVADELLETLNSIKVKGDNRTRKSVLQAVRAVWEQDHIDALQRRLDRISKQLIDGVSMEQLEEINRRLREMAVENTRLEINRSLEIDQLRQDFNSAIEEIKANLQEEQMTGAWLILSDTARRGQGYFAEQVILQSLRFSSVDYRHESIAKEHSETFSWIFDETSSVKFVEWLKNEDGVYWVSGKPGSGKSTLMKFLATHQKTWDYLNEWAGDKKLIVAKFYFWSASTHRSQKSQQGLLRAILYQILRQCPELIQVAYYDQWVAMTSDGKILRESRDGLLSVPALLDTLTRISALTSSDTKFCFFIDGLDEYDGRPADIIQLVGILKSFQNIKTCVSSRPWNEFEDCFGKDNTWKLYMHELTENDIGLYVEDTLGKDTRFQQLKKTDPQCPDFVWYIVREADGVFLWVFLVIRSLLDGLTNSDRVKDLQKRVEETPKDLEGYFEKILFSTENRYRNQTARVFTIAVNAAFELPLMAYWVIDQEDTKYLLQLQVETPPEDVLRSRVVHMKKRLKALSKGLLDTEMNVDPESIDDLLFEFKVEFLHRTVKDYLQTAGAQSMLQEWSDEKFNADWEICTAVGALAKMAPRESFHRAHIRGKVWRDVFTIFFIHASRLDQNPLFRADFAAVMDDLQTATLPAIQEHKETLCEAIADSYPKLQLKKEILDPELAFISACVVFGLATYAGDKFAKEPLLCSRASNHFPSMIAASIFCPYLGIPSASMIDLVLNNGVDPNRSFGGESEWRLYLEFLMDNENAEIRDYECIKMWLSHGANFEQQCTYVSEEGDNEREASADELLREWFNADQFGLLQDIVKHRARKTKKRSKIWQLNSKSLRHIPLWIKSKK